ncbi:MFS general substrate transporter [Suillus clintonianus]|uniref:MFS general substrate transporter n=1 Tax=Suillus clintonianus TaxID=1904413 RepID=UPI001B88528D|nr:MFS general substrate transporter [Suillus clintonianus]KAG2136701.1 MFS general substrate transporter [Suillus clintonianus]
MSTASIRFISTVTPADVESKDERQSSISAPSYSSVKPRLPLRWQMTMIALTCMCTFGHHWSNGIITTLKTTIEHELKINNSEFATLMSVASLVNTFLCIALGFVIDKFGGPLLSAILAAFCLAGAAVEAGATTNGLNSYHILIVGKIIAAIGGGSLDNAQHKIFTTYFAPGHGFALSIGFIWSMANVAQYVGQSTANVMSANLGSYSWPLWIGAIIGLLSFLSAICVFLLDKHLRLHYEVIDHCKRSDQPSAGGVKAGTFHWSIARQMPFTFWFVVLFAVFQTAGVASFVSVSTQFAQQRLKKGAVVGGWVSSFYLILPIALTPLEGVFIDAYGRRVTILFLSACMFLISMLLLRFSETVPTFVCAYVFYAFSQCLTSAPQVEIVRNIIPDPHYYATAFAIKKSIVQGSVVIVVIAAGKLQDLSPTDSLESAVTLWLVYAFVSVLISGALLSACYTSLGQRYLPAARLSQVRPKHVEREAERLWELRQHAVAEEDKRDESMTTKQKEVALKSPVPSSVSLYARWVALGAGFTIVLIAWVIFGFGIEWGEHASVSGE